MRLIDADALIEGLFVNPEECPGCPEPEWLEDFVNTIDSAPTIEIPTCSNGDAISRQAAIEAQERIMSDHPLDGYEDGRLLINALKALPSVQPDLQPTCNQLATDCISRQAAIDGKIWVQRTNGAEIYSDEVVPVEYLKMLPSAQPESTRTFVELVVRYPDPELCTYKEYKGKPYYSIKYIENGETYVGYGTYNPEVLSQYLREYFISSAQPDLCDGCDRYGASCVGEGCGKLEMPEVAKDTNVLNNDCISRQAVKEIRNDGTYIGYSLFPDDNADYENGFTDAINKVLALPSTQPEQSIAQERYEDLCEYFKDCSDQGRSILNDRKEFKSWLDRMKWHVMECNKLGRELEKIKSAQPEPCADAVSREYLTEHIEACWMNGRMSKPDLNDVLSWINDIPSAQPEIIRCKDCKHYRKEHGWNCIEYTVCAISPIHTVIRKPDDYCSRAKRKDDEKKNI